MSTRPLLRREPAINLPGLVTASIVVLLAIHAIRAVLPDGLDAEILFRGGFIPAQWTVAAGWARPEEVVAAAIAGEDGAQAPIRAEFARFLAALPPEPWSVLSYTLLHGSWLHVGLNTVWLAAFGSPVVRRCGAARSAVLALAAALGGVLAHWATNRLGAQPVIGASAVVSGFMAAAATFAFSPDVDPSAGWPPVRRRASLARILDSRNATLFLGSWFVINLLFGLLARPLGLSEGGIAWEAHIGGLLAGLAIYPLLDPAAPPKGWDPDA